MKQGKLGVKPISFECTLLCNAPRQQTKLTHTTGIKGGGCVGFYPIVIT